MPTDCISYQNSGYFSALMNDYLDQKNNLDTLYNRFPILENFEEQILEKQNNFDNSNRSILVSTLQKQYLKVETSVLTKQNIESLNNSNTFTVTTGHQLNLFSGPLYFLYKIISTINLTTELKSKYPSYNFVPIYWMATEDHDFEEINYFNFKGKKFRWNKESTGPVGRLSTEGLADFLEVYALELGSSINANTLKKLFEDSYLKHDNLADATRFLANALFGNYGLVIMDADNADLKRSFIPYIKEELLQQTSHKLVLETAEKLKEYTIQVNPREINLFYIEDNIRERIIFENNKYKVNHTKLEFYETEILSILENHPEKFSPNVIMRPLYQEVILPNLCYIGGGGEIAYWLELKSFFAAAKITFPMLLLRNSVLLATEKQAKKADQLNLSWSDLFSKQQDLRNDKTKELSEIQIDLKDLKDQLKQQFDSLHQRATKTDQSFMGALKAQEAKQIKGLENLEKRLLKAQKRTLSDVLQRITDLQNELFPNQSLQERQNNFSEFYLEYGENLIPQLIQMLKPLQSNFDIIKFP
ncbi:bacillithiol biosynthesis cysteine-adding enzyme BshC [Flavobacterium sp. FPG59]|jgi:bacillithiol biosynthesis cysteine-adding enzyme BshC|uniref:bacillithiol biosynthesis cysteine-adding enzyme BshC n=1 Tax=Flavobacterium sp. FPG59 TaxID=1929267 RepID=UPI000A3B4A84|nr:bacillithiol biosynthesis cysteine-adding enzyme BshC [Flavobacterium sp. FPG59]OUD35676.1 bacillithiol biosynthesis cysteine-adding enzyme BshC [Flavobacterium sp. FPG59]